MSPDQYSEPVGVRIFYFHIIIALCPAYNNYALDGFDYAAVTLTLEILPVPVLRMYGCKKLVILHGNYTMPDAIAAWVKFVI